MWLLGRIPSYLSISVKSFYLESAEEKALSCKSRTWEAGKRTRQRMYWISLFLSLYSVRITVDYTAAPLTWLFIKFLEDIIQTWGKLLAPMALLKRYSLSLLSMCLFLASLLTCVKASEARLQSQDSDRVTNLPGQPSHQAISHFSGYVTVNQEHGRALFYWFFEAQSEASKKPLLLWLNGGPGCSSIGYGAAAELGPLRVNKNGADLHFNKYAWTKEANLLFLESPAGVGFSYSNTSSDLIVVDDVFVAEDTYNFLVNWLQRFPQYKTNEFFIAGESYAGHYVPQLAELVFDRNNDSTRYPFINLKGFIVGNAETNDFYDYNALLEFAWNHFVLPEQLYNRAKQVCDFKDVDWPHDCFSAVTSVFDAYGEIDIFNVYAPRCLINKTYSSSSAGSSQSLTGIKNYRSRKLRIPGSAGYDPCYSAHLDEYFNRPDVQASLHADARGNFSGKWSACNDLVFNQYNLTVSSVLPIYTKLIKGGLKIWMYSGDIDGRVPSIGSRNCVESLGLPVKSPWRSWFHNHQVAGSIVEYRGLTFVTVRGAGHLVPLDNPSAALSLIHSFLSGEPLPLHR